jgi:formate-dependent nitrite reductase membrane component NrfD
MKQKLTFYVTLMVSFTLCIVVLGMVATLMTGLFDPSVDNSEIFKLINPAFQTVVGGFIGLLAGVKLSSEDKDL